MWQFSFLQISYTEKKDVPKPLHEGTISLGTITSTKPLLEVFYVQKCISVRARKCLSKSSLASCACGDPFKRYLLLYLRLNSFRASIFIALTSICFKRTPGSEKKVEKVETRSQFIGQNKRNQILKCCEHTKRRDSSKHTDLIDYNTKFPVLHFMSFSVQRPE